MSVGEQEKRPKLKAVRSGAGRIKNLRHSALNQGWSYNANEAQAFLMASMRKCSPRHFARAFEKTATQGDVAGWNLKEFRKNLWAVLIATVSNKFSLRGEPVEPGELGELFFCLAVAVSQVQMWQNLKRLRPWAQSPASEFSSVTVLQG